MEKEASGFSIDVVEERIGGEPKGNEKGEEKKEQLRMENQQAALALQESQLPRLDRWTLEAPEFLL